MTKPFTIIGLTGPKACGKDTVADLLRTHCGFIKMGFADALYAEVSEAFGVEITQLQQRETKEHPMSALAMAKCLGDGFTGRMINLSHERGERLDMHAPRSPRQILQWWGTEYRRSQSQNYWVGMTSARIAYFMNARLATRFVLTDCRFPNEVEMVRGAYGGRIWQVKRPGCEVPADSHTSETTGESFNPEAVIDNDNDMRHLRQLVLGEFWAHDAGLAGVKVEIAA
jgi:hypothetical protein